MMCPIVNKILIEDWYKATKLKTITHMQQRKEITLLKTDFKNK